MQIKTVFVKEISKRVKILCLESTKETGDELTNLSSEVNELSYRSWVIESFIVGINKLFGHLLESTNGNIEDLSKLKNILYEKVIDINPQLAPENIYMSPSNNLTLTKQSVKLIDCESWGVKEENSSLMLFDLEDYYKITENVRNHEHYIEIVSWDLFPGVSLTVRQFNKNLKTNLMQGYTPVTEDDVKYFIVITCIDNLQNLIKFISYKLEDVSLPFEKVLDSLYQIAIANNPFLKVKVKDFNKLNKAFRFHKAAADHEEKQIEAGARKSLLEVPHKEIANLYSSLSSKIFGQDEAIEAVCKSIRKAHTGIKQPKTPIGAFFFYGPTSVGKTELAKVIAKSLTKSTHGLVKVACNTMISSHNVHTLIGAPPGYVGYEEKGLLTRALENSKFKVILFDEVEKAHPKLLDIVLEVLEEGELMTADGDRLDLSDCLIIFTSNIGQGEANNALNTAGFISPKTNLEKEAVLKSEFEKTIKNKLKPEFLARLTGEFYFSNLPKEGLIKVAGLKLNEYSKILSKKKIKVSFSRNLPEFIVNQVQAVNGNAHARNIRNYIDMQVIEQLGDFVLQFLEKNSKNERIVEVSVANDKLSFNLIDVPYEQKQKKV